MKAASNVKLKKLIARLVGIYREDGIDSEDLTQEAWVAVLENEPKYSIEMNVSLRTFLGRRIRDRLRQFKAKALNRSELERYWEAPSISDGPEESIRASSKEVCEALATAAGRERFGKIRRVEVLVDNTVSMDAQLRVDTEGDSVSLHDEIGVTASQEAALASKEAAARMLEVAANNRHRTNHGDSYLESILNLLTEGFSFGEIASKLEKNEKTVRKMWERAQRRINEEMKAV